MQPAIEIDLVLVQSLYESNIGACSRAMANMAAQRLILIDPQCEIGFAAQQAAARGQEALQNRQVYKSWQEFFAKEPEGYRLAFTARDGQLRPTQDLSEVLDQLQTKAFTAATNSVRLQLIFGREDAGLANTDLEHAHYCVRLPTYGQNVSLNLAQAVLLACFLIRQKWGDRKIKARKRKGNSLASIELADSLKLWLTEMKMDLSQRRFNAFTVINRWMLANAPSEKEARILEIAFRQSARKLSEYNQLRLELAKLKKSRAKKPSGNASKTAKT